MKTAVSILNLFSMLEVREFKIGRIDYLEKSKVKEKRCI